MKFDRRKVPQEILFDVGMQSYMDNNSKGCEINEHLGDIYSYQDLKDHESYVEKYEDGLIEKYLKERGLNVEDYLLER